MKNRFICLCRCQFERMIVTHTTHHLHTCKSEQRWYIQPVRAAIGWHLWHSSQHCVVNCSGLLSPRTYAHWPPEGQPQHCLTLANFQVDYPVPSTLPRSEWKSRLSPTFKSTIQSHLHCPGPSEKVDSRQLSSRLSSHIYTAQVGVKESTLVNFGVDSEKSASGPVINKAPG